MTFSAEFRPGLRATLTVTRRSVNCEWTPDIPRNVLQPDQREAAMDAYRVWRNECLAEFAKNHGLVVKTFTVGGLDAIALCEPEGRA